MSNKHTFIIIKGQPKSLQIESIDLEEHGLYAIKFKNNSKIFHYRYNDVIYLKDSFWHDHLNCKVFIGGCEQQNVTDIRSFKQNEYTHWRITFTNGYIQDYLHGNIHVIESCLSDNVAKNAFNYLKRIAKENGLGKDEEHGGILSSLYDKVSFIDSNMAVAPYLYPEKYHIRKQKSSNLLFPFGCNASQEKAVTAAFENQYSVIEGPPGTGKTQTILNIIANIIVQNKKVIVVSNNNSATTNVLEKLEKYGIDFIVAPLGKRENKEEFIKNQPKIPQELHAWGISLEETNQTQLDVSSTLNKLKKAFTLQEELASCKQEIKAVKLEWQHFMTDNQIQENTYIPKHVIKSQHIMKLWLEYQAYAADDTISPQSVFSRLKALIKWIWINLIQKHLLGIKASFNKHHLQNTILELQSLYYTVRIQELSSRIKEIENELNITDVKELSQKLTSQSFILLKNALHEKYHQIQRHALTDIKEIRQSAEEFCTQYPIILSTTFSARTAIPEQTYDYLIMDEASQVSIETGALALTCAKNVVIVGDTRQLPNVVTEEDRIKFNGIFEEYKVSSGYHCANYSFLESVCKIIPDVPRTLLREHYRCHPTIINFCNQRYYGGDLLLMTEDHNEKNVMMAIKTIPGHHSHDHYNQREIDVVKKEILPILENTEDVGIITPYNNQVKEFTQQLPEIETATIHKYQGREKDTIIMSVVDDVITEFSDNSNLINVAISRAKKHFYLVVTGNKQENKGNISELIDYISYNNLSVTNSKISSIFDYLFSHYTSERIAYLKGHKNISEYDSENLTYSLLENILKNNPEYHHLGILCHIPLRSIIRDRSFLNDSEKKYISNPKTHLDFLIINHVTKKPILAIETDGYSFHHKKTEQYQRDLIKDHILELYGLPLIRLKTNESGEEERIQTVLSDIIINRV